MTHEHALPAPPGLALREAAPARVAPVRGAREAAPRERCVEFRRIDSREQRARVFELRRAVYTHVNDYLLVERAGFHAAEDEHDADAHLFACELDGALVATCRFTPPVAGRFEASELCDVPAAIADERHALLQVSRVVVREDVRGVQLAEVLIYFACRDLARTTRQRGYFALCLPRLAAFYRHFGAHTLDTPEVCLPQRHDNRYRWIRGDFDATARTLERYLTASDSGAPRRWSLRDDAQAQHALCTW